MGASRRTSFAGAALLGALATLALHAGDAGPSATGAERSKASGDIVAVGDLSQTSAVLWAHPREAGTVEFVVATDPRFTRVVATGSATAAADVPAKFVVTGLGAGTQYFVRVTSPTRKKTARFRTLPGPLAVYGLRFGVSGGAMQKLLPYPSVHNVPGQRLDFFVLAGDTIHADDPSPNVPAAQASTLAEFRAKHDEAYSKRLKFSSLGRLRSTTPVFVAMGEREVNEDFAGGADPASDSDFPFTTESFVHETSLFQDALQAFAEFNPVAGESWPSVGDPRTDGARRLYRTRTIGSDAALFVLDTRSFRDGPVAPPDLSVPGSLAAFEAAASHPTRTMLGTIQESQFLADLGRAQTAGVTWKIVVTPDPIQNLPPVGPQDRWDGYIAARSRILAFILRGSPADQIPPIENVVFVSAGLHGTFVNDLEFVESGGARFAVPAFEVTTGAIAHDPPLGPQSIEAFTATGLITPDERNFYDNLRSTDAKDAFLGDLLDSIHDQFQIPRLGLDGSAINATLEVGRWTRAHTFGWTKFEIHRKTQRLTVTTYGIAPYDAAGVARAARRRARVVQRFSVAPQ